MANVETVIAAYIKLRAKKDEIENKAKADVVDIKDKMTKLEAWLQTEAEKAGVTSFKSPAGTAFVTTTDFATVDNWDAVLEFVRGNDAWDMLEKRISKTAVRSYMTETSQIPPGVSYGTRIGVNVRKPTGGYDD
jgi:prophage tail gpP-like protein